MKIGLISDTHGWLDPAIASWFEGVEMILHAGDVGRESVLDGLRQIAPTHAVRGNVDGGPFAMELPEEQVVEAGGMVIAVRHIAGPPGRPNAATRALIERSGADLLLTGHSHLAIVTRTAGVVWVNPGAAGRLGLHTTRSAALLRLEDEGRHVDMIELGPRGRS